MSKADVNRAIEAYKAAVAALWEANDKLEEIRKEAFLPRGEADQQILDSRFKEGAKKFHNQVETVGDLSTKANKALTNLVKTMQGEIK